MRRENDSHRKQEPHSQMARTTERRDGGKEESEERCSKGTRRQGAESKGKNTLDCWELSLTLFPTPVLRGLSLYCLRRPTRVLAVGRPDNDRAGDLHG